MRQTIQREGRDSRFASFSLAPHPLYSCSPFSIWALTVFFWISSIHPLLRSLLCPPGPHVSAEVYFHFGHIVALYHNSPP